MLLGTEIGAALTAPTVSFPLVYLSTPAGNDFAIYATEKPLIPLSEHRL
jgi:hypothetical protein